MQILAGGFSIVSYTEALELTQLLTQAWTYWVRPEYMIIKNTGSTDNWINYNKVGGAVPNRGQINTGASLAQVTHFVSEH